MAKPSQAFLTIFLTLMKDFDAPPIVCQRIEGQERIYSYVEAADYLLNLYATDDVIAKPALQIGSLKTFSS